MMDALQSFMKIRREQNDFVLESDIKHVESYNQVVFSMQLESEFSDKFFLFQQSSPRASMYNKINPLPTLTLQSQKSVVTVHNGSFSYEHVSGSGRGKERELRERERLANEMNQFV